MGEHYDYVKRDILTKPLGLTFQWPSIRKSEECGSLYPESKGIVDSFRLGLNQHRTLARFNSKYFLIKYLNIYDNLMFILLCHPLLCEQGFIAPKYITTVGNFISNVIMY